VLIPLEASAPCWAEKGQAIKRLNETEEVTGAVLFLTTHDAAFVTGQAIVVDGSQYRIG
jgi:NAD(P)-dependent dehydrogenase (short-subunit alcohol dehydrogenase family)